MKGLRYLGLLKHTNLAPFFYTVSSKLSFKLKLQLTYTYLSIKCLAVLSWPKANL